MMPTIGRIVHYVLSEGQVRPGIITHVWSESVVNLNVFTDGSNDPYEFPNKWITSVRYGEQPEEHSWHWPEREVEGVSNA